MTHVEKTSSLQNSDILMTINRLEFDIKLKSILKTKLRLQLMTSEKKSVPIPTLQDSDLDVGRVPTFHQADKW